MTNDTTRTTAPPTRVVPPPVHASRLLLALIGLSHLAVPLVMLVRAGALRDEIAAQHHDFGPAELDTAVRAALVAAVAFHAVLLLICGYLALALPRGRFWLWRLALVSQALGIVFSTVSWSSSTMFHAVIPIVVTVQAAVLVLLLLPASRAFFKHSRREGNARRAGTNQRNHLGA